jgi:hypothetical protein
MVQDACCLLLALFRATCQEGPSKKLEELRVRYENGSPEAKDFESGGRGERLPEAQGRRSRRRGKSWMRFDEG